MCIIGFKDKGISLPTVRTLKNCFSNHSDGAGYFFKEGDTYKIRKGFLTFESFLESFLSRNFTKDDILGFHFRTSTSGKVNKGCTHPFPITSNEKQLNAIKIKTDNIFIHNGVLGSGDGDLSDTQVFVRDVMSYLIDVPNLDVTLGVIEKLTAGNVFLVALQGKIHLLGGWVKDRNGVQYSNYSYSYEYGVYGYQTQSYYPRTNKDYVYNRETNTYDQIPKTSESLKDKEEEHPKMHITLDCPVCSNLLLRDLDRMDGMWFCEDCSAVMDDDGEIVFYGSQGEFLDNSYHQRMNFDKEG